MIIKTSNSRHEVIESMWHRDTKWSKHDSIILLHIVRLFVIIIMLLARFCKLHKSFHQFLIFFQQYFSSELETFLKTDSSDYVSVKVLSQKENDDLIKSIFYFSKTLFSVECNYEIHDKKLLTIIDCFEQ